MPETPRDQPSQVATEETVERPSDEHVTTSDTANVFADTGDGASQAKDDSQDTSATDPKKSDSNDQDSDSDTQDKKSKPQRNRRSERKIGRLSKQLAQSRAEAAESAQRIADLEDTVSSLVNKPQSEPEPMIEDFKTPQEYAKAYALWEKPAKPAATKSPAKSPAPPPKAPAQKSPLNDEIASFNDRGVEKYGEEFAEALADREVAVNQYMAEFMMDSEFGAEIYIHLANNPEESILIHDSSPYRSQSALQKLEARAAKGDLDVGGDEPQSEAPQPKKAATRKASKAPPPPSSTKDGGSVNVEPDPENESMDDYAARRTKEMMRRRGVVT